jgi:ADP-heptose:LPS heptosyltransferase
LRRNILIFHLGALGDFIVTWPLALALARLYPQSRVFYVTHGQKGALAERVLRVESADAEAGWHHLFAGDAATLPDGPRRMLAGSHTVVNFVAGPSDAWVDNVRRVAPDADLVTLAPRPPDDSDFAGHVSEWLLAQLEARPAMREATVQILRSVSERGLLPRRSAGDSVVIHPGAGSPQKRWPAAKFAELAGMLNADGMKVTVIVGEAELDQGWSGATRPAAGLGAAGGGVITPADLVELMQHVSAAKAFVGNDSGPGHLAGVLGVPTVSIFGPAGSPARWRPLGPGVRVVRGDPLQTLEVSAVYDAVRDLTR